MSQSASDATASTEAVPRVACLCAAWCRLCDGYAPVFDEVTARLRGQFPGLQAHWIDIEDEADLVGDLDVETFPTLLVTVGAELRFAGTLTPQAGTLERVLRSALARPGTASPDDPLAGAYAACAERLRARYPVPAAAA